MSDLPMGWARAVAAYENDANDYVPRVCRHCDRCGEDCGHDPTDCAADACEREAEERWEAARERYE